jgi:two-component system NtrC family sensor kinase
MKLARKLYLYFIGALIIVLSIFGCLSFQREAVQLEIDMGHHMGILGRAVAAAVTEAWRDTGQERAMAIVNDVNTGDFKIECTWVWLETVDGRPMAGQLNLQEFRRLLAGRSVVRRGYRPDGTEAIFYYFPVSHLVRPGAIQLSEPLSFLKRQSMQNAIRLAVVGLILIVAIAILGAITGQQLVGRRMQALVGLARRIGRGELEEELVMNGNDEITELCREMNAMARQLIKTKKELLTETEARVAAIDQLRHAERLATLGKLSSGMAHELGTPLNVVSGRAKMIASDEMPRAEVVENATIIVQQTERIATIMRQMLDYARRRQPHHVLVDFKQLVSQVFGMLKSSAEKQGVVLSCEAEGQIPQIAVDPTQIQQVMINMVMNGIQAMANGGTLSVSLRRERCRPQDKPALPEADYLAVQVMDEGEGIAPANLALIFDPFFTTKSVGKGTGLGLSIAHGIIQEHNGWITVNSEMNKGSCFTIYLPLQAQLLEPDRVSGREMS